MAVHYDIPWHMLKGLDPEIPDICTLKGSVPTGLEPSARDEVASKLRSVAYCARGRVFFDVRVDQVSQALKLRSMDHIYVLIAVEPKFGFSKNKVISLKKLRLLPRTLNWKKALRVWQNTSGFEGDPFTRLPDDQLPVIDLESDRPEDIGLGTETKEKQPPRGKKEKCAESGAGRGTETKRAKGTKRKTGAADDTDSKKVATDKESGVGGAGEVAGAAPTAAAAAGSAGGGGETLVSTQDLLHILRPPVVATQIGGDGDAGTGEVEGGQTPAHPELATEELVDKGTPEKVADPAPTPGNEHTETLEKEPNTEGLSVEVSGKQADGGGKEPDTELQDVVAEGKQQNQSLDAVGKETDAEKLSIAIDEKELGSGHEDVKLDGKKPDTEQQSPEKGRAELETELPNPATDTEAPEADRQDLGTGAVQGASEVQKASATGAPAVPAPAAPESEASTGAAVPSFRATCYRAGGGKSGHAFSSNDGAENFGGAVQELFQWKVKMKNYDIEVVLDIEFDMVSVALSLTPTALFYRNLVQMGPTSLRSTICFNLLMMAKPQPYEVVIDPMCGGGSISLEGVQAFPGSFHLCGDNYPDAAARCRTNRAYSTQQLDSCDGKQLAMDILTWDCTRLPLRDACADVIVSDLPFGKRMGSRYDNRSLYPAVLEEMARVCVPRYGRAVLLTADRNTMQRTLQQNSRVRQLWRCRMAPHVNIGGLDGYAYCLQRSDVVRRPPPRPARPHRAPPSGPPADSATPLPARPVVKGTVPPPSTAQDPSQTAAEDPSGNTPVKDSETSSATEETSGDTKAKVSETSSATEETFGDTKTKVSETSSAIEETSGDTKAKVSEISSATEETSGDPRAKVSETPSATEETSGDSQAKVSETASATEETSGDTKTKVSETSSAIEETSGDSQAKVSETASATEETSGDTKTKVSETSSAIEETSGDSQAKVSEISSATEETSGDPRAKVSETPSVTEETSGDIKANVSETASATEESSGDTKTKVSEVSGATEE